MAGLYVHIPFCRSKCAYCDFYSAPFRESEAAQRYVDSLLTELRLRLPEIAEPFSTVYLGGGTPSLLSDSLLAKLMTGISRAIDVCAVEELTVEANPEDISPEKLNFYMSLGINRVSIGIQSFSDSSLRAIGRQHSAEISLQALDALAASGVNYNADLIYALPGQTPDQWRDELNRLISFRPPHISAYLLSYEPGTRLHSRMLAGKIEEASEQTVNEMYAEACAMLAEHGYEHYEIANFALSNRRSRHNSAYWRFAPYLGLGAGAHSFDGLKRRYNPNSIKNYISSLSENQPYFVIEERTAEDNFNETILVGLRTERGIDARKCLEMLKNEKDRKLFSNQVSAFMQSGRLIHSENGSLRIPESEWLTADAVIRDLFC